MLAKWTALLDARRDLTVVRAEHGEPNAPIVEQDAVARLDVLCESFVGAADSLRRTCHLVGRDDDLLPLLKLDRAAADQRADANLRTLEILHDRHRATRGARRLPDRSTPSRMLCRGSVREIEAGNIQPRLHEIRFEAVRGGPERGHNLYPPDSIH